MGAAGDGEENASVKSRCPKNPIFLECEWIVCNTVLWPTV